MLPLIAGCDDNPAMTSLRVPRYCRGQGKARHIATVPAGLPKLGWICKTLNERLLVHLADIASIKECNARRQGVLSGADRVSKVH